jgi:hypothetical protein
MYKVGCCILFLLISVGISPCLGQSLHPQGLFSSIHISTSPRLSYTLGELAVLQFPGGGPSVQHGYLASVTAPFTITSVAPIPHWDEVFQLYPNPVSDWLTLKRSTVSGTSLKVQLMDALGRSIRVEVMPKGQEELLLPVGDLPSGLHLLTVSHPSGVHLYTFQFVKP